MVRGTDKVMRAWLTPEGAAIKEFLQACLDEKDKECRVREGNDVYRAQGAANELAEIIDLANNARDH